MIDVKSSKTQAETRKRNEKISALEINQKKFKLKRFSINLRR